MPTVLITGANRGLGKALADEFAETYDLILHSRKPLEKMPPNAVNVCGDLCEDATIWDLEDVAGKKGVNILINNAAVYISKPFEEMSLNDMRHAININLLAPMFLTSLLWPHLMQSQGIVVNVNSLAALQGGPGESLYSATKAGLLGFTETVQFDATSVGIKVINVNLGGMNTDMAKDRKDRDKFIAPQEAARAIFNLCQNYSSLRITSIDLKRRVY